MTVDATANPSTEAPPAAPRSERGRPLAAALAVYLGGYLILQSLSGALVNTLAGFGAPGGWWATLLVLQLAFAVLVVVFGFWLSPASVGRKAAASALVVIVISAVTAAMVARISGALPLGQLPNFTITNPWFMTALVVGAGWLIVRGARLGWLALLPVAVLSPLPFAFSYGGLDFGLLQFVMLTLTAIAGAGILAAGRPWRA